MSKQLDLWPLTAKDFPSVKDIVKKYSRIIRDAHENEIEVAARWYEDANQVAWEVVNNVNTRRKSHYIGIKQGAAIIAAFSPRQRWSVNIASALSFSMGNPAKGTKLICGMAERALVDGIDALKGPKINAFARAIAGDENAICIDSWMIRAAGWFNDSITLKQYRIIAEAIKQVAFKHSLSPRTCQALIWIKIRRRYW